MTTSSYAYPAQICGSAAIDVIYTSVLCARLAIDKRESAFAATSLTLGRILSYTLTTSAVTTTCALLAMFLYYCYSIGTVHLFFSESSFFTGLRSILTICSAVTILPKLYIVGISNVHAWMRKHFLTSIHADLLVLHSRFSQKRSKHLEWISIHHFWLQARHFQFQWAKQRRSLQRRSS